MVEKDRADKTKERVALTKLVLEQLYGGLWHTTHPERFAKIIRSGAILPEPDVPDGERWKTSLGKEHYPYVRSIGGVSRFDFEKFDPARYGKDYPTFRA